MENIEGSLEPELMFQLAERNGIELPYATVEEAKAAYDFKDLQGFLNLYYQGMNVLRSERDFYDLAMDYFKRARSEGVLHIDMHFDPQAHLQRGLARLEAGLRHVHVFGTDARTRDLDPLQWGVVTRAFEIDGVDHRLARLAPKAVAKDDAIVVPLEVVPARAVAALTALLRELVPPEDTASA